MRYVTYKNEKPYVRPSVGMLTADQQFVIQLSEVQTVMDEPFNGNHVLPDSLLECIKMGDTFLQVSREIARFVEKYLQSTGQVPSWLLPVKSVELLAPIPRPRKNIFCVGKNYAAHATELGGQDAVPEHIIIFSKTPTTVSSPNQTVSSYPHLTQQMDYEGELAVVIGKKGKAIQRAEAMNYVFGYTIVNDLTARDLQSRHQQFLLGKSLDGFCPLGPYLVSKEEIPFPHRLHIETRVNQEVRQSASTSQMIFDIPQIIETLSAGMTLEPGDMIATGTPAGVGHGMHPPKYLKSGDVVEVEIEGIGLLRTFIGD